MTRCSGHHQLARLMQSCVRPYAKPCSAGSFTNAHTTPTATSLALPHTHHTWFCQVCSLMPPKQNLLVRTVQLVLTTTCVQQPSVSERPLLKVPSESSTIYGPSIQRPPVLRDHTCLAHTRSLNTGYTVI